MGLWVAVTESENPTSIQEPLLTIPITAVNVPSGLATRTITPQATLITVSATDDDFEQLTAANFEATVDMTEGEEGTSTQVVAVRVEGLENVEVAEVTPRFVEVTLENETSKEVPVRVNRLGSQAVGFIISSTEANPPEVQVSGASSLVQLVDSAAVDVNLTGLRSSIQQEYHLTARDADGADVPRVILSPSSAEIRMTILQQENTLVLPVQPTLTGTVPDGYNVSSVSVDPATIPVSGSLEALQQASVLTTDPIDLGGEQESLARSVRVNIPAGVEAPRDSVTVSVVIEPAPAEKVVVVAPQILDVPDGLEAVPLTTSLVLRLRGTAPVLQPVTAQSVQATVSMTGLEAGLHTMNVDVQAPDGVEVASIEPPQIVVDLR